MNVDFATTPGFETEDGTTAVVEAQSNDGLAWLPPDSLRARAALSLTEVNNLSMNNPYSTDEPVPIFASGIYEEKGDTSAATGPAQDLQRPVSIGPNASTPCVSGGKPQRVNETMNSAPQTVRGSDSQRAIGPSGGRLTRARRSSVNNAGSTSRKRTRTDAAVQSKSTGSSREGGETEAVETLPSIAKNESKRLSKAKRSNKVEVDSPDVRLSTVYSIEEHCVR